MIIKKLLTKYLILTIQFGNIYPIKEGICMNHKYIVTENKVIVSDEKGNLRVTNNNNLNERLKLENNWEVLEKKYKSLDELVDNLTKELEKPIHDIKRITRDFILIYGANILIILVSTGFTLASYVLALLVASTCGIHINYEKKETEEIKKKLELARLNRRLAGAQRNEALSALISLSESENVHVEEFTYNKEYTVDDNYDYTFTEAEYVEPEKPLSLARIKRVCREKLDKKRR